MSFYPEPLKLWDLTAEELSELAEAREADRSERLSDLYQANKYLAFNTAALSLTAFNAPQRFPQTPQAAFPSKKRDWREAKAEMLRIAGESSGKP